MRDLRIDEDGLNEVNMGEVCVAVIGAIGLNEIERAVGIEREEKAGLRRVNVIMSQSSIGLEGMC